MHGTHKVASANIEVTFKISLMPYCILEGVTSLSTDTDKDGVVDSKDNCRSVKNLDQKDTNNNGVGDVCEFGDIDKDGAIDSKDNCKWVANPDQKDEDNDGIGDVCKDVIL